MSALRHMRLATFTLLACSVGTLTASAQLADVGNGGPGPFKAPHLTVELVALAPQIASGGTQQLGLSFTIEEKWHVYWINAGDSGEPPDIKWTLPKGITADALRFPPPERLPLGPLMDFGYEDQVTFPIALHAASGTKPGRIHLDARVSWLVCAAQCLPGKAHLGLDLDVVAGALPDAPLVGALGSAIKTLPKPLPANMSVSAVADAKEIVLTLHSGGPTSEAEFYPFLTDVCTTAGTCAPASPIQNAADQIEEPQADGIHIRLTRATDPPTLPKEIHGLLSLSSQEVYEFTVPLTPGVVPARARTAEPKSAKSIANTPTVDVTIWSALGLALVGGMLLNLMPCVFPVLFLKGLALVHASGEERGRQRLHGAMYTVGILVSFWAVVGTLLILRAGGASFGWGFQLQSPAFVAIVAALLFFVALSLAGQFDIGLSLTSTGDALTCRQGLAGSFFTGVLATVVATPCTAPLMGAAIGFALAQSALVAFGIFTALALGLALPYLLLSWQPSWTRILPRPGAWMEVLKQLTAVPLFATTIWLAWVYASLFGADGINREAWLLGCFLTLAVAGWVLGKWPARWPSSIVAIAVIAFALFLPLAHVRVVEEKWEPYTAASLAAARATGRPVFIDFTAAWCLSCKVNEAAVLDSSDVMTRFAANNVILLRADWTRRDDVIAAELATLGRNGVPTYVIYPPGTNANPDVLPELLTKSVVIHALDKDLGKKTEE